MKQKDTQYHLEFQAQGRKKVIGNFQGGDITSDGGVLLLQKIDKRLNLTAEFSKCLKEYRTDCLTTHSLEQLFRQRVYALTLGYEDLNDHDHLRHDSALQTALGLDRSLASSPTLSRFENSIDRTAIFQMHEVIVKQFIDSFEVPPKELILDFDATDTLLHGNQEGRFYHGYYGNYCFLPLYVYCGQQLLASYLRRSNKDGARHAWAILSLLVNKLRSVWPNVKIIFRGDSGFCRHTMLDWCDKQKIGYIVGIAQNKRLNALLKPSMIVAKDEHERTGEKQRVFAELRYKAGTWKHERRVVGKAEHTSEGSNPRFVVTNLRGEPKSLYDDLYCARGEMENRIKETQLDLFADRVSCQRWWANQFRLMLSSAAYILMERFRALALRDTELRRAQTNTIRLKLFKIGAIVIKNTRKIRFLFSSNYPYKELFVLVLARLAPG